MTYTDPDKITSDDDQVTMTGMAIFRVCLAIVIGGTGLLLLLSMIPGFLPALLALGHSLTAIWTLVRKCLFESGAPGVFRGLVTVISMAVTYCTLRAYGLGIGLICGGVSVAISIILRIVIF